MQESVVNKGVVRECHILISKHKDIITNFCKENHFSSDYIAYSQCTYRSKQYKKGFFICQYVDINIENAIIYEIKEILLINGLILPYVVCNKIKIKDYNKHFAAFEIVLNSSPDPIKISIISISALAGPPINSHLTARGSQMIRPKQFV